MLVTSATAGGPSTAWAGGLPASARAASSAAQAVSAAALAGSHTSLATPDLATKRQPAGRMRIGLLGLGNVGQALLRLCCDAADPLFSPRRASAVVVAALVRTLAAPRACRTDDLCLTDCAETFFSQRFEVLVDVSGALEAVLPYVQRALRAGIPVVSANKALLAVHGPALQALANAHSTVLRGEAAVVAGVAFLESLRRRPFSAAVSECVGVLNATSNFVLTHVAEYGESVAAALRAARERGLAEPDASRDIGGADAADKLCVLWQALGYSVSRGALETRGIDGLIRDDFLAAAEFGAAIRPIAYAARQADELQAFVGPALLGGAHRLAGLRGAENGVILRGPRLGEVFHAGLGAGPQITAATLLDDVVELSSAAAPASAPAPLPLNVRTPVSEWLVRLSPRGCRPPAAQIAELLGSFGVWLRRSLTRCGGHDYALTHACSASELSAALAALRQSSACSTFAIRALEV